MVSATVRTGPPGTPAVTAERLTFRPAGAAGPTPVRDLSFHLPPGETLLVSGPTGAGKSTLLKLVAGLAAHFPEPAFTGSLVVRFPGDAPALDPRLPTPRPGDVGYVAQEAGDGLIGLDVVSALAFPFESQGRKASEALERIDAALHTLHIHRLAARDVTELSGGERRRVALAGVLALDPPLVLLDEPLADLDPDGARQVLADLHRLQHERTMIVAEHRTHLIAPLADRTLHLVPADTSHAPRTLAVPRQGGDAPRIRAQGLTLQRGGRTLLRAADLAIDAGVWGLIGPNGAGKSTLLAALAGLHRPRAGIVDADGIRVWPRRGLRRRDERALRQALQVTFQEPREAFFAPDASSELAAPLVALGADKRQAAIRAQETLQQADRVALAGRSPLRLSGGEARILQLLGALVVRPRILFLDEPTHGLDARARDALTATIRAFAEAGGLVVVATHEPAVLPDGTRFLFLAGDGGLLQGDEARPGAPTPRRHGFVGGETVREVFL